MSEVAVSEFCGGHWNQQTKQGISQLTAFFRLKPDVAEKLWNCSGAKGLFVSTIPSKMPVGTTRDLT